MPRRGNVPKRDVLPDPMYGSELVTRLVNNIMLDGKKGVAQKIVYGAFDIVAEKSGKGALEAFEEAMENIMPQLEVKARRVGGATYQVPMEVRPERRRTLGLRWITLYARQRNEKTMKERLANEILDAMNGEVNVSGSIDNIDSVLLPVCSSSSRSNCDTSFLLLLHPVHRSRTVVCLTDLVVDTGVEQDTLGSSCLTCVDVSHDTNITGHFKSYVSSHISSVLLITTCNVRKLC